MRSNMSNNFWTYDRTLLCPNKPLAGSMHMPRQHGCDSVFSKLTLHKFLPLVELWSGWSWLACGGAFVDMNDLTRTSSSMAGCQLPWHAVVESLGVIGCWWSLMLKGPALNHCEQWSKRMMAWLQDKMTRWGNCSGMHEQKSWLQATNANDGLDQQGQHKKWSTEPTVCNQSQNFNLGHMNHWGIFFSGVRLLCRPRQIPPGTKTLAGLRHLALAVVWAVGSWNDGLGQQPWVGLGMNLWPRALHNETQLKKMQPTSAGPWWTPKRPSKAVDPPKCEVDCQAMIIWMLALNVNVPFHKKFLLVWITQIASHRLLSLNQRARNLEKALTSAQCSWDWQRQNLACSSRHAFIAM